LSVSYVSPSEKTEDIFSPKKNQTKKKVRREKKRYALGFFGLRYGERHSSYILKIQATYAPPSSSQKSSIAK
jgi:hypothetical protein